jgi:AraC-like DNA-binding protein
VFRLNFCEFDCSAPDGYRIYRPNGSGDYRFLLWKTPMRCCMDGFTTVSQENACLLYTPGFCQDYQAVQKFRNSYMHFFSDLLWEEKYNIPVNRILYPGNFRQLNLLLNDIQQEYLSGRPYCEERIRNLTEELFLQLSRALQQPPSTLTKEDSLQNELRALRLQMLRNCDQDWPIERLCGESHLGKSQFYFYYKRLFGASPKEDLLEARMDKASTLLTNEALQVQQVARLCGFTSLPHFSRAFRARYHCAPSEYASLRTRTP